MMFCVTPSASAGTAAGFAEPLPPAANLANANPSRVDHPRRSERHVGTGRSRRRRPVGEGTDDIHDHVGRTAQPNIDAAVGTQRHHHQVGSRIAAAVGVHVRRWRHCARVRRHDHVPRFGAGTRDGSDDHGHRRDRLRDAIATGDGHVDHAVGAICGSRVAVRRAGRRPRVGGSNRRHRREPAGRRLTSGRDIEEADHIDDHIGCHGGEHQHVAIGVDGHHRHVGSHLPTLPVDVRRGGPRCAGLPGDHEAVGAGGDEGDVHQCCAMRTLPGSEVHQPAGARATAQWRRRRHDCRTLVGPATTS